MGNVQKTFLRLRIPRAGCKLSRPYVLSAVRIRVQKISKRTITKIYKQVLFIFIMSVYTAERTRILEDVMLDVLAMQQPLTKAEIMFRIWRDLKWHGYGIPEVFGYVAGRVYDGTLKQVGLVNKQPIYEL